MQSLAMLYFKKGDFDNGVKWLKKRLTVEGGPSPRCTTSSASRPGTAPTTSRTSIRRSGRKIVEEGLQALNKAIELKPDYFEAVSYINLLYREKAKIETDPVKKQEYIDTANKYLQQALEMRKAAQEKAKAEAARPRRNREA